MSTFDTIVTLHSLFCKYELHFIKKKQLHQELLEIGYENSLDPLIEHYPSIEIPDLLSQRIGKAISRSIHEYNNGVLKEEITGTNGTRQLDFTEKSVDIIFYLKFLIFILIFENIREPKLHQSTIIDPRFNWILEVGPVAPIELDLILSHLIKHPDDQRVTQYVDEYTYYHPLGYDFPFSDHLAITYLKKVEFQEYNKNLIFYLLCHIQQAAPQEKFYHYYKEDWKQKELIAKVTDSRFLMKLLLGETDFMRIQHIKSRIEYLKERNNHVSS